MSKYITLSSDYHVLCLNENGEIEKQLQADDPVFEKAIGKMIESFNEARLEQYLDDDMAKKCLGYTVKDKIRFQMNGITFFHFHIWYFAKPHFIF